VLLFTCVFNAWLLHSLLDIVLNCYFKYQRHCGAI